MFKVILFPVTCMFTAWPLHFIMNEIKKFVKNEWLSTVHQVEQRSSLLLEILKDGAIPIVISVRI